MSTWWLFLMLLPMAAQTREVQILDPRVDGYPLDYCREWGQNCGKPAADAYCQSIGYRYASEYTVKHDTPPTKVIHGGGLCVESYCDRIVRVVCEDGDLKE